MTTGKDDAARGPRWREAPECGGRATSLRAMRRLWRHLPEPTVIIEVGAGRDPASSPGEGGAGSTLLWAWYAAQVGGRLIAIDADPAAIEATRRHPAPYADRVEVLEGDALDLLEGIFAHRLDLGLPWDGPHGSPGFHCLHLHSPGDPDAPATQRRCLDQAARAAPMLATTSLVLVDATGRGAPPEEALRRRAVAREERWSPYPGHLTNLAIYWAVLTARPRAAWGFTGLGALAVPYLALRGFQIAWADAGRVLLVRAPGDHVGPRPRRPRARPAQPDPRWWR
jgi:hypothetical protein